MHIMTIFSNFLIWMLSHSIHAFALLLSVIIGYIIEKPRKQLWFKLRKSGLGWYPTTWQGWFVLAAYILTALVAYFDIQNKSKTLNEYFLNLAVSFFGLTLVLIFVCYKTGEQRPKISDKNS